MDWQKKHQQKIESFPDKIREAHKFCIRHRLQITNSKTCGCFYCISIFHPSEIVEWIHENGDEEEQTALCPKCGIDSVLGDISGYNISKSFLREMHQYWF